MNNYFGENIRRLRKEKELTQETLADFLGVSAQAVSKWERGETFPDITMLPAIASFFDVTTDLLLGVDILGREERVKQCIDFYSENWQTGRYDEICDNLRAAMREIPGDYRLIVRYFNSLIAAGGRREGGPLGIKNEAVSLYNNIQNYCTDDSIRVWAQSLMCNYYKKLSEISGSGVTLEDAEAILGKMPLMQNGRDYFATYMYGQGEKRGTACKAALTSLIFLTDNVIINMCRDRNTKEQKIHAVEAVLGFINSIYTDGDYGKQYINVIRNYAWLGRWYYETGDTARAVECLTKSAEIAARFDAIPDDGVMTCTSELVRGESFRKNRMALYSGKSEREGIKDIIGKIHDAEALKCADGYDRITRLLG